MDMLKLVNELEAVVRRHLLDALPDDPTGALEEERLWDLLVIYATWQGRFVAQRPRAVHISSELAATEEAQGGRLDPIVSRIEGGDDLTPYLSTRVHTAYEPQATRNSTRHLRGDRDLLLADWGLHHLHLRPTRSSRLVFARFAPDDAYLIGLYEHGDWALLDVLERLIRNWPDDNLLDHAEYVTGLTQCYSDADRLQLRNAGVNVGVEIDGRVYMTHGQSLDGAPMQHAISANNFMWTMEEWQRSGEDRLREKLVALVGTSKLDHYLSGNWEPCVWGDFAGALYAGVFVPMAGLPETRWRG